jgi:DHA1 family tetracycline resistance protein-like MFS transporter
MTEIKSSSGARPAAMVFIFITVLIDTIGFGIILPVTPQLIMQLTGEGVAQAAIYGGWLAFVFALLQFFAAPVIGNLSDRFGRRPVLLFSLFAFGLDYLVMGFAPTLAWLFIGRAVAGIAGASYTTAYAYIADISPPEKRAQNFGMIGAAFGTGFVVGPAIGGLLGELGPRAPFFVAAGMALLNFVYGYFILPETLVPGSRRRFDWKRANPVGTLLELRKYPVVLGLAGAMFLWQLGHQVLPNTWAFYTIYKFNWSAAAIGYSLAFVGVIMAISQGLLTGVLVRRLGEHRAALIGLVFGALCYLGYAFATQGWMMYVSMLAWFLGALAYPAMNAMMSHQVPASAQGELQGGVASLYSFSSILGPPMMTGLFGYFSSGQAPVQFPGAAFFCAALLTGVGLLLYLKVARAPIVSAEMPAGANPVAEAD